MNNKVLTLVFAASVVFASATANAEGSRQMMRHDRPSPEMMENKLADRLKLNDEQRKFLKERRMNDQQQIKDLMQNMKTIRQEMDKIRKANMEAFEIILTPEQKAEFNKIKEEKKARHMERRKMNEQKKIDMPSMKDDDNMLKIAEPKHKQMIHDMEEVENQKAVDGTASAPKMSQEEFDRLKEEAGNKNEKERAKRTADSEHEDENLDDKTKPASSK